MNISRSSLLRYLTPGIVVALVLGYSFVIPATANDDKNSQCGYGYTNGHTDNESEQGEEHESQQAENNDEPCGELDADKDAQGEDADKGDKSEKAEKPDVHTVSTATHKDNKGGDKHESENKKGGGDD